MENLFNKNLFNKKETKDKQDSRGIEKAFEGKPEILREGGTTKIDEKTGKIISVYTLEFRGGGKKVLDLIRDFYNRRNKYLAPNPFIKNFGIILDGDKKCFVLTIEISYPSLKHVEVFSKNPELTLEKIKAKLDDLALGIIEEFKQELKKLADNQENI